MSMNPGADREVLMNDLEEYFAGINTDEALKKVREKAWSRFLDLGLPSRKTEVYKYLKLQRLFSLGYRPPSRPSLSRSDIEPFIRPESTGSVLVFVNGRYSSSLSSTEDLPTQVSISDFSDATLTYGTFLHNHWNKSLKEETDAFAALNAAVNQNGLFIYIPPKTVLETPLQIIQVIASTVDEDSMIAGRINVFAGAHAEVDIFVSHCSLRSSRYFVNNVIEMALDEGAHVKYTQTLCDAHPEAWHLDAIRAHLKKNATLRTVSTTEGAGTHRSDYRITLAGENAEALLNGVWMLSDKREAHANVFMDHAAPNCRSYQLFKGVVNDHSRSAFEGKIMVRSEAQKTEAFQLNNNIVLSDFAHAASKPNLEIFADDVKASHGATVGKLDPEQLFYMRTRGFPDREARNMLIYGFCEQIIEMIPVPSLREAVSMRARKYLTNGTA